jgi:hypothetical protein
MAHCRSRYQAAFRNENRRMKNNMGPVLTL